MDDQQRQHIIDTSWALHAQVEEACLQHPAKKGDDDWADRQRLLLADMALHLLQTALNPGELRDDKLRNNLNAILTISDTFLPDAGLKQATESLYPLPGDKQAQ
ncbi:hypothetical protein LJ739_11215 [Aestuariibacter halophilus]|uniref:Flagellar protein FliT n=1 Tax=Fluctibacter halophilus TaxID=226011 RepID=A0ABS8G9E7_9ALTE|nr:hypothetical protein [Aestuariibacter halophilus]MCC2616811.1 hypothetical protein [Aestuariibacter halophilus]